MATRRMARQVTRMPGLPPTTPLVPVVTKQVRTKAATPVLALALAPELVLELVPVLVPTPMLVTAVGSTRNTW